MNQLNLAKHMAGQLEVSPSGISLKAAGQRGDEMMEFNIQFPEQVILQPIPHPLLSDEGSALRVTGRC